MTPSELSPFSTIGLALGAALSLMVFSYLLGNNPAYRLALHLFLGATTGYAFGVVTWEILILRVGVPLVVGARSLVVIPLMLGILLLLKLVPRRAYLGNLSMGFLAGTGAAVAISGAVLGTVVPLVGATANAASPSFWVSAPLGWLDGLLLLVGTVCTLVAFQYLGRRGARGRTGCAWPAWALGSVGRWFLIVAFGVLFGGALSTALSIFVGRVQYWVVLIGELLR